MLMQLGNIRCAATLIWLEDTAQLAQWARQLKLAAVGRLSANIAHEIRNPLAVISIASQLLRESDRLDDSDRRLLDSAQHQIERVNGIIENVLQLSRRGASHLEHTLQADWLNEFVEDAIDCERLDENKNIVDVEPDDLSVEFVAGHLYQMVWNRVQNACEHAGQSSEFRVWLEGRITETGQTCIDIIDNGPGICTETAQKILKPFYDTSATGAGLGLYLARELAETDGACLNLIDPRANGP